MCWCFPGNLLNFWEQLFSKATNLCKAGLLWLKIEFIHVDAVGREEEGRDLHHTLILFLLQSCVFPDFSNKVFEAIWLENIWDIWYFYRTVLILLYCFNPIFVLLTFPFLHEILWQIKFSCRDKSDSLFNSRCFSCGKKECKWCEIPIIIEEKEGLWFLRLPT